MMKKERSFTEKYNRFIERVYENSRLYRDLVFFSRIVKMLIYVLTGASIIIVVLFGQPMASFGDLVSLMTQTLWGKVVALLVGLSLIVYGLEKPRR